MTYEETKAGNLHNAAPAMLKLLQHIDKTYHSNLRELEANGIRLLLAEINSPDLLSEELFNHIVSPILYHHH